MSDHESSIIHFANVTKTFGSKKALHDVSFRITPGEVIGFVGPNGAGKTTTISAMLGFIAPTSGEVTLFSTHKVTPDSAHKTHRRIGFGAGDMSLFDNLTGEQYLAFQASRFGLHKEVQNRLIQKLDPQLKPKLRHLSRGNKQKIALIAALQHDPELIILDEPTSGLDPLMQEVFLDIIKSEAERGATIFMSSHILSEVARVCSRVLFMKAGRIVTDSSMTDIEQSAGKIVTVVNSKNYHPPVGATVLQDGEKMVLRYDGELDMLLRWLNLASPSDVTIEDRDLDDIFIDLYREEEVES